MAERLWTYAHAHPQELPPLPGHSQRILALSGQIMQIDITELLLLVRADPTCAAELLRMANSPMFARNAPVGGLDEAIIRLGRREVYNVLATVAARGLFRPQSQAIGSLWPTALWQLQHRAVVCAFVGGWLAHGLRLGDYEGAFLLGLFHGIGRLAAVVALGDMVLREQLTAPADPLAVVQGMGERTLLLGPPMLRHWGLPPELIAECEAMAEPLPQPPRRPAEGVRHAVRLIDCMQQLADRGDAAAAELEAQMQRSRQALGLAETQLGSLEAQMASVAEQVQHLIGAPPAAPA